MNTLHRHHRRAFTLLEVVLALGLTVIVMALVGTALTSTLRLVESGRVKTERDQLARAILAKIGDDVRATVRYEPFDSSGMMKLATNTTLNTDSTGQSSSSGTTGTSGTSSSSSTTTSGGTSTTSGTSSSGSQSSGSSSGSSSSSSGSSSSSTPPPVVSTTITGLIGDDTGLQIDIGRIPRLDEYVASENNGANQSSAPPPSDVRRVMYYLANSTSSIVPSSSGTSNSGTGLIRSEFDHASAQYTVDTGGDSSGASNPAVVAPEVLAIEFSYYDGSQWNTAWDTTSYNGLPQLIKISIVLSDPSRPKSAPEQNFASVEDAAQQDPDNVYSVIVRMPACDPIPAVSSSGSSSGSSSSSSGSSSTSGSSGTSSTGGGGSTSAN
jgi:Prokaryotic N-terminal methylation motif